MKQSLIKTISSEKWLSLAASKNGKREALTPVYGNMASDGYRMHIDPAGTFTGSDTIRSMFSIIYDDARKNPILTTTQRTPLFLACLHALAIGKGPTHRDDNTPALRLKINGRIEYMAEDEEHGKTWGELPCEHAGADISISINPALLRDALAGMTGTVYLAFKRNDRPVYITDETGKEAIVMPLQP